MDVSEEAEHDRDNLGGQSLGKHPNPLDDRDLGVLALGHPEHLAEVLAGYGRDVESDLIPRLGVDALTDERPLADRGRRIRPPEEINRIAHHAPMITDRGVLHFVTRSSPTPVGVRP